MKNICRYHYQNLDDMIYSSSDNRAKQTQIGNFRSFLPFIPLKTTKIKISKNEKFAGGIIILQMCTKNYNHMMCCSWDSEWDRQKILSLWAIFCLFTSALMILNMKILKKMKKMPGDIILLYIIKILKKGKKYLEISSFYISVQKIMIR